MGVECMSFAHSNKIVDNETGHKAFFNGRAAACLKCATRLTLEDFSWHICDDHTISDIIEGFIEACFYIDDLEMKKSLRYKK
jgi:hypothetical protein